MDNPMTLVYVLGVGAVVLLLICISLLCKILDAINARPSEDKSEEAVISSVAAVQSAQDIPNRKKIVAAVSAAIAEELGCEVSAIRIKSFKKI